ncbi:molybdopterin-binding protein [Halomicrobium katesii]|uniref:molybdopterin-binding protein n=1 Tax=Halomicrobium katesii TaxID=437163 RepID=UPI00035D854F|nr:molybdopterin-binding protein [Halomicrobium katesii]
MVDFQSRNRRTRDDERAASETDSESDEPTDGESESSAPDEPETTPEADEPDRGPVAGVAVVTVADDRTVEDDSVGDAVIEALGPHELVTRELLGRDHDGVQGAVDALVNRGDVDGVVTVGGTGTSTRDITVEAVHPLFEKALPGFGELFRQRFYEEVGSDVIAIRAAAGIADGTPVFCLPDSVEGARIGTEEIVVEQVGRLSDRLDEEP